MTERLVKGNMRNIICQDIWMIFFIKLVIHAYFPDIQD
jgi:hypothetical protein